VGAPQEIFIDPSIAGDSGTGTSGDPFGDLQFALDRQGTADYTRDATNGDRFNIKSGTAELLSTSLSLATYGTPTRDAPLIFQGFASTEGDGDFQAGTGIAEIDMQGNNSTIIAAGAGINFMHVHLHGTGNVAVFTADFNQHIIECEISEGTGGGITGGNLGPSVIGCHIHDTGGIGVNNCSLVLYNYFKNDGTTDFTTAIDSAAAVGSIVGNIISVDGSSNGIVVDHRNGGICSQNSIFSSGTSGTGITYTSPRDSALINNLVEGFNIGILYTPSTNQQPIYANNKVFNATTDFSQAGQTEALLVQLNEVLSATPFDKSGSDTFINRKTFFSPVDTGNVHGGAYKGAS